MFNTTKAPCLANHSSSYQYIKSKVKEAWKPVAYNQRGIVGLKILTAWTKEEEDLHFKHNRLLQTGFMRYDAKEVLRDAKITQQKWLTDIACPSVEVAIRLHIATQLLCHYQIEPEKLDHLSHILFESVKHNAPTWDIKIQIEAAKEAEHDSIKALKVLNVKYPNLSAGSATYLETLKAFTRIEAMLRMKIATHKVIASELQKILPDNLLQLKIKMKPVENKGENQDFIFLGAMGSGKSSIAKQQLSQQQNIEYVMFSVDTFRGVTFGTPEEHFSKEQVYIKTQDTAFMIKELVQQCLLETSEQGRRPNIIVDSIRYESCWDALLIKDTKTIVSMACLDDASLVMTRVYNRAESPKCNPADQGRHINTESLIKDHILASERLISNLPLDMDKIELFNTNTVDRIPIKVAQVNTKLHVLKILKLDDFAVLMGKINLNSQARSRSELYYQTHKKIERFTFTARHQAAAIMTILPKSSFKSEYSITLCDKNGEVYATLCTAGMFFNEHGREILNKMSDQQDISKYLSDKDNSILRQLMVQSSPHKDKKYLGDYHQFALAFFDNLTKLNKSEIIMSAKQKILI